MAAPGASGIVGARIREQRRSRGVTQADLARRVGISPSYLNLIERNRRRIAGRLLGRIAAELALPLAQLDGQAERRLLDRLGEVAADPRLAALGVEAESAGEFVGRYPGWARATAALARSERESGQLARALADRLAHDPFLGQTVHRMLTHVASLRSAAEILEQTADLDRRERARFQRILTLESRRLSDVAEALAAYFDKADTAARAMTPLDEVEALFEAHENRFEAIEAALGPEPAADAAAARVAAETRAAGAVERIVAEADEIETATAAARARRALMLYAADAARLPAGPFAAAATAEAFDIERLARTLGCTVPRVCRRLTALGPAEGRPRFGYLAANAAGALTDLRALPGFSPSRHATHCALWVLARAQQTPERAVRQLAELPDGERFVFVARARVMAEPGFQAPRHFLTDMLVMRADAAEATVYRPVPGRPDPPEPVGMSCRICPRRDCAHRVEDPLVA
ncbi:MAG TPA: short-chain fatty acyl-CoA regulator family protein [Thermohalobaculum sp.]|nr:short-chain fatty acyl-CoA regulator family protein [Thermohalobaculum sp.]